MKGLLKVLLLAGLGAGLWLGLAWMGAAMDAKALDDYAAEVLAAGTPGPQAEQLIVKKAAELDLTPEVKVTQVRVEGDASGPVGSKVAPVLSIARVKATAEIRYSRQVAFLTRQFHASVSRTYPVRSDVTPRR